MREQGDQPYIANEEHEAQEGQEILGIEVDPVSLDSQLHIQPAIASRPSAKNALQSCTCMTAPAVMTGIWAQV